MYNSATYQPPQWGNFIHHADQDLMAFATLSLNPLQWPPALYHGAQAAEKYLKTLILSLDPTLTANIEMGIKKLKSHKLQDLVKLYRGSDAWYSDSMNLEKFKNISEYDQATRYPYINHEYCSGYSINDIRLIIDVCKKIRKDLPIVRDDYHLALIIRGFYHHSKTESPQGFHLYDKSLKAVLITAIPEINEFIHWPTDNTSASTSPCPP